MRRSKYGSVRTEVDGIRFDSKAEAARYGELSLLLRSGAISDLRRQVRYPLTVNGMKVCDYLADFTYVDAKTGKTITEDVKGTLTDVYRLKKKLMAAIHGITIQEVTKG